MKWRSVFFELRTVVQCRNCVQQQLVVYFGLLLLGELSASYYSLWMQVSAPLLLDWLSTRSPAIYNATCLTHLLIFFFCTWQTKRRNADRCSDQGDAMRAWRWSPLVARRWHHPLFSYPRFPLYMLLIIHRHWNLCYSLAWEVSGHRAPPRSRFSSLQNLKEHCW